MAARPAYGLGFALGFALGFVFGTDPLNPDTQEHDGISYDARVDPDNGGHVVVRVPGQPAQHGRLIDFFTVTRGSIGTFRGRDGLLKTAGNNVPRIEYDATGNVIGLLLEGARTNVALQSEALNDVVWVNAWGGTAVVTANDGTLAPDGAATADLLTSSSGVSAVAQGIALTLGQTYTFTFYARRKLGGSEDVNAQIQIRDGSGGAAVQKASQTFALPASGAWVRGSVTWTADATATFFFGPTVQAPGTSGIYYWGAQVENAAFASSYIATAGVSVTRAADTVQRTVGAEVSSSVGSVYVEADAGEIATINSRIFCLDDGTGNNRFAARFSSSQLQAYTVGSAVSDGAAQTANTAAINTIFKGAVAYGGANDLAACLNGGTVAADTALTVVAGPLTRLSFFDPSGGDRIYGHLRRFDYRPERLPNAVLQGVTA